MALTSAYVLQALVLLLLHVSVCDKQPFVVCFNVSKAQRCLLSAKLSRYIQTVACLLPGENPGPVITPAGDLRKLLESCIYFHVGQVCVKTQGLLHAAGRRL